jgi:hypothetical protein
MKEDVVGVLTHLKFPAETGYQEVRFRWKVVFEECETKSQVQSILDRGR